MRLGINMPSAEEPVSEVADALDAVVVVLLGLGPGEVRVRSPLPDEPGHVVEPFGHPAVELVLVLEVLASPAHRLLEAAEGRLVPYEPLTAQAEQEGALVSLELTVQEIQLLVHVLNHPGRVPGRAGHQRSRGVCRRRAPLAWEITAAARRRVNRCFS